MARVRPLLPTHQTSAAPPQTLRYVLYRRRTRGLYASFNSMQRFGAVFSLRNKY